MRTYLLAILTFVSGIVHSQTVTREAETYDLASGVTIYSGSYIGDLNNGPYAEYRITVATTGWYTLAVYTAAQNSGGAYQLRVAHADTLQATVNNTGSYSNFQPQSYNVYLTSGTDTVRFTSNGSAYFNIDKFTYRLGTDIAVNAGADQPYTLNPIACQVSATASDPDQGIASYSWSQISGTGALRIVTPGTATTQVLDILRGGTYTLRCTVVGNDGSTTYDDVTITGRTCADGIKHVFTGGGSLSFDGDGQFLPGDTIAIAAGYSWGTVYLGHYSGVQGCPITIVNQGGLVQLAGLTLKNDHYIRVVGSGSTDKPYGFYFEGINGVAMEVGENSSDIEITAADVYFCTYGAWVKQDPSCDFANNYPAYEIANVWIHHCRFRRIGQDCIYAGNTTPNGRGPLTCGDFYGLVFPVRLRNFQINDCLIDSCVRTGLQISECRGGRAYNNTITRCGYQHDQAQGAGIVLGGHTYGYQVDHNTIKYTFLEGLVNLGKGSNRFSYNTVDSSGFLPEDDTVNVPALAARLDADIKAHQSGVWDSLNNHLRWSGQILYNTFAQPASFKMRPDHDYLQDPELDSSISIVDHNRFGASMVVDTAHQYIGGNANKIGIFDLGYNPLGKGSIICSNTLMDGTTAAAMFYPVGFVFSTNCSLLDIIVPPVIHYLKSFKRNKIRIIKH